MLEVLLGNITPHPQPPTHPHIHTEPLLGNKAKLNREVISPFLSLYFYVLSLNCEGNYIDYAIERLKVCFFIFFTCHTASSFLAKIKFALLHFLQPFWVCTVVSGDWWEGKQRGNLSPGYDSALVMDGPLEVLAGVMGHGPQWAQS